MSVHPSRRAGIPLARRRGRSQNSRVGTTEPSPQPVARNFRSAEPDVFISYSRKDAEFVRRLHAGLIERGKDVWVDWEDIPPTASWRAELDDAIAGSGAFVFVISPHSRDSEVCRLELEHAVSCSKRVVPIVREPVEPEALAAALSEPNWISFADDDRFDESLDTLLTALETDLDWVRTHTRLLVSARRWSERRDRSLLLSGSELREVERRLAENADREPRPTPLQAEFVLASRRAAARRQRITLGATLVALVVSIALGVVALAQRNVARSERDRADAQARLATSRQLAAQADATVGAKLDLSLLLARAARAVRATPEARASLFRAVSSTPQIRAFLPQGAPVSDVAFSRDGSMLAAGAADGRVTVWATRSLRRRATLGSGAPVTRIRFGPDSHLLAVGRRDGTVEIWDAVRARRLQRLRALRTAIGSLALAPRARLLAAADKSGRIAVWARPRWTLRPLLKLKRPAVALAFGSGDHLYAGDGVVVDARFDTATGKRLAAPTGFVALADAPSTPAYSDDARRVAVGAPSGYILLEDASSSSGGRSKPIAGPPVSVEAMAFDHDAGKLVSVGQGTLTLWDVRGRPIRIAGPLRGFSGRSAQVALAGDARTAAVANGSRVILWGFAARSRLRRTLERRGFPPPQCCQVAAAAFGPDSRTVAWLEPPGDVTPPRLELSPDRTKRGRVRRPVQLPNGGIPFLLLFRRDGGTLVSIGSVDISGTSVVVRDARTLRPRRVVRLRNEVDAASFVRRSHLLVAVGATGSAVTIDTDSGRVRLIVRGSSSRLPAVAVSADGATIAAAQADGTVVLWDEAGHRLATIETGIEPRSAALSRNGELLAVVGTDGTAAIWDVPSRARLRTLQLGDSASLRFSPDGRTLAVATSRGEIALWDVRSGTRLGSLAADPGGYPIEFAFAPNGKTLLSAGADGVAFTWDLDDHAWDRIACRVAGRPFTRSEREQFLGAYASSTRLCD